MAKTNLVDNFLTKDLDLYETIDDDSASKVVGGAIACTQANRRRAVACFQAAGLITPAQARQLLKVPLKRFCLAIYEFFPDLAPSPVKVA